MSRRRIAAGGACVLAMAAVVWLIVDGSLSTDAALQGDERTLGGETTDDAMRVDAATGETKAPALEGREAPAPDPSAGRGSVEVLVVGPNNVPLPGVVLEAGDPQQVVLARLADVKNGTDSQTDEGTVVLPMHPSATTDADGKAYFADLPYDGTVAVRPRVPMGSFKVRGNGRLEGSLVFFTRLQTSASKRLRKAIYTGGPQMGSPVTGPELRLVLRHGLRLRLVEVAASSGSPLEPAAWGVAPQVGQAGDKTELRTLPHQSVRATPGARHSMSVTVSERMGFVADRARRFKGWISPMARELVAYFPHRPEAELMVTVPREVPLRGGKDWSVAYRIDGRARGTATAHMDGFGRLTVRGVPFLPGQQVRLDGKVKGYGKLTAAGRFGFDHREPLALEGAWQPVPSSVVAGPRSAEAQAKAQAARAALEAQLVAIQKGTDELAGRVLEIQAFQGTHAVRLHVVDQDGRVVKISPGNGAKLDPETQGRVNVRVRRVDGTPAAGASVYIGTSVEVLSTKGTASFAPLLARDYDVRILGAGATFSAKVTVTAGETTPLELDAPHGGSVDVEVVDEEGRGLPFAQVFVKQASGLDHADLEGETQRVDPFTDHQGRRTLRGVEVGEVEITAVYGSRKAQVTVQVHEQDTALARVVLAQPAPPKPKSAKKSTKTTPKEAMDRLRESELRMKDLMRALEAAEAARKRGK